MGNGEKGGLLAYSRCASGTPLVFLHGLGASRFQAQAAINDLSGLERITIDAPGHGDSAQSTVPSNFGAFAGSIIDLLDGLNVGRAIFGGISMGAGLALRIARDFPERVKALVLVRPAWVDKPGRPHLNIVADIGEWIASDGLEAARQRLKIDERYQHMITHLPLAAASVAKMIEGVAATGRADVLREMVDSHPLDDGSELVTIAQRALVIANEHDPLHPIKIAHELVGGLPNTKLVIAPPRYLNPVTHQNVATRAINSFIADDQG